MFLSGLLALRRIRRRDVVLRVFPANARSGPVNGVLKGEREKGKAKGERERLGAATSAANRL
jgi:hypothetical protein